MKRAVLIFLIIYLSQPITAQKENNLLKKHELSLLKLLLSDSIQNSNFILSNYFNFGLDNQRFTNSSVVKRGKEVFIQPLGTGQLFIAKNINGAIHLDRVDQTTHSGVNFFAQDFLIKDTLYQFGGIGFWQIRGILSYYSKQTKQWELLQSNRAVPSFFDEQRDAVVHFDDNRIDPKLYITNSYYYPNYPSSFELVAVDSCYEFNFHTRTWKTLGIINPDFKKLFENKQVRTIELHLDSLYVFQSQLEFYWVNFENNQLGQFNAKEKDRLRQAWLSFYNNDRTRQQTQFQFNIGNDLYYAKVMPGEDLEFKKINLNLSELNRTNTIPIYINSTSYINYFIGLLSKNRSNMFLSIALLLLLIALISGVSRKKRMPKEVAAILYQNFFNALTIVEKELIEALYQSNLKGGEVSTRTINKIIGVQQKDTLTQNKSRSDHFIKINQKFKMATQNIEPLVIKNRDKADKRQYNYDLNKMYIIEIEKQFKD